MSQFTNGFCMSWPFRVQPNIPSKFDEQMQKKIIEFCQKLVEIYRFCASVPHLRLFALHQLYIYIHVPTHILPNPISPRPRGWFPPSSVYIIRSLFPQVSILAQVDTKKLDTWHSSAWKCRHSSVNIKDERVCWQESALHAPLESRPTSCHCLQAWKRHTAMRSVIYICI